MSDEGYSERDDHLTNQPGADHAPVVAIASPNAVPVIVGGVVARYTLEGLSDRLRLVPGD